MSQVKKLAKPKKLAPFNENAVLPAEPKQRKSRAKPKPTREEAIKMLSDASTDIKLIIKDLEEDEQRLQGQSFKKLPELVKETILNLTEDLEEIEDQLEEIRSNPESQ